MQQLFWNSGQFAQFGQNYYSHVYLEMCKYTPTEEQVRIG